MVTKVPQFRGRVCRVIGIEGANGEQGGYAFGGNRETEEPKLKEVG